MVERQDMDSCLVYGGQQMILTGQNFTAESKVVFMEKTTGPAGTCETQPLPISLISADRLSPWLSRLQRNPPARSVFRCSVLLPAPGSSLVLLAL